MTPILFTIRFLTIRFIVFISSSCRLDSKTLQAQRRACQRARCERADTDSRHYTMLYSQSAILQIFRMILAEGRLGVKRVDDKTDLTRKTSVLNPKNSTRRD